MTWRRYSVPIALVLGPLIITAMIMRNWHGWTIPPYWLDDLLAGVLVAIAGAYAYQELDALRARLISAAMAFAVAVAWASMFEDMAGLHAKPEVWSSLPGFALMLSVIAFALAVVGLAISLPSQRKPMLGTRYPEPPKPAVEVTSKRSSHSGTEASRSRSRSRSGSGKTKAQR
ncbi:MAG: hypothetical protein HY859_04480 [Caulobacterales bacterium]|nr:hypothetical protein [Caulobacterales bacterium]